MKPVHIAVCMEDSAFGEALGKGLAEAGHGFLIEVVNGEKDRRSQNQNQNQRGRFEEILITDQERKAGAEGSILVNPADCCISRLCREILIVSDGMNGPEISRNSHQSSALVIGFAGLCSGCGTTVLALAFGRMLAGAYGERVLYLPMTGEDDSLLYGEREERNPLRGKEFLYRLLHDLPCSVEAYTLQDSYGLSFLDGAEQLSAEERLQLLGLLAEKNLFERVIADLGSGAAASALPEKISLRCGAYIEVYNRRDCRCQLQNPGLLHGERRIAVWNRSERNAVSDDSEAFLAEVEIMEDGESFLVDRGGQCIEIGMTKNFAMGVKNLTDFFLK